MRKKKQTKDAVVKASEMMHTPTKDLPPLALEYMNHLCRQYGMCGEVLLTALAHYNQIVEHLECSDELYKPENRDKTWFKEKGIEVKIEPVRIQIDHQDGDIGSYVGIVEVLKFENGYFTTKLPTGETRIFPENSCKKVVK